MSRAEALVADAARSGVENANFWRLQTVAAVRCLLHAAALDLSVGEQRCLVDGADDHLGAVDAELVGAAETVEEDIADAVAAAKDGLRIDRIGEAESRAEIRLRHRPRARSGQDRENGKANGVEPEC